MKQQLGVNIDHVATIRQARGGRQPEPLRAAQEAVRAGAHQITVHLREDRRHIQDFDVRLVCRRLHIPVNLEMAVDPGIVRFALWVKPEKVCFVPERRQELTTEGGLDVRAKKSQLKRIIPRMKKKGIRVSLFIDPSPHQLVASRQVGADAVELHTGAYAEAAGARKRRELARIRAAARLGRELGLKIHAGHGLDYQNVGAIARIAEIEELNIGHSIVSRAVLTGMYKAVREMLKAMRKAR